MYSTLAAIACLPADSPTLEWDKFCTVESVTQLPRRDDSSWLGLDMDHNFFSVYVWVQDHCTRLRKDAPTACGGVVCSHMALITSEGKRV